MLVGIMEQRRQEGLVARVDAVGGPQGAQAEHAILLMQDLIAERHADGEQILARRLALLEQLARLADEVDVRAMLQLDQLLVAQGGQIGGLGRLGIAIDDLVDAAAVAVNAVGIVAFAGI